MPGIIPPCADVADMLSGSWGGVKTAIILVRLRVMVFGIHFCLQKPIHPHRFFADDRGDPAGSTLF